MKLEKLTIKKYKIFENENVIRFPKNNAPAVFVGINGAGKTTVIDAIIGCLWIYYYQIQGKSLKQDDRFARPNVNINADEFADVELECSSRNFTLKSGFQIRKTVEPPYILKSSETMSDFIESMKGDVGFHKATASIPIVVYYPVERTVLNPSLKTNKTTGKNQFSAYENAFEKSVNFNEFFEWFRSTEDLENEIRLNEDSTYSDKGLDAVRNAVLNFLDKFSKIRVRRTSYTTLILTKDGNEYEVNQLSHGEKAVIALIGDLARRLVIANPGLPNPLKGEGVVLIDELDLHLHPKWQRTILGNLTKTFPNLQFICTTHSPLVINHAEKESVFLLENGHVHTLKEKFSDFNSYGADVEDVLRVVQGAEKLIPTEIKNDLQNLFVLINEGDFSEAKSALGKLKSKTDPNHPEIKRAETEINYQEILGQKA